MKKILIISDNLDMVSFIETKLSNAGWLNENISTNSIMARNSTYVRNNHFIVMIVDAHFVKRFGSIVDEMSAMIRNCSMHTPLYLLFEGGYEPCFASWVQHTKRRFKLTMHDHHLRDAISEIIRLESEYVSRTSFCSPMDSI